MNPRDSEDLSNLSLLELFRAQGDDGQPLLRFEGTDTRFLGEYPIPAILIVHLK